MTFAIIIRSLPRSGEREKDGEPSLKFEPITVPQRSLLNQKAIKRCGPGGGKKKIPVGEWDEGGTVTARGKGTR